MRRLIAALGLTALASSALAADYEVPTLRGSSPFVPAPPRYRLWEGWYAGGQIGAGSSHVDFANTRDSLILFSREVKPQQEVFPASAGFGTSSGQAISGGVFFGYNTQWDELLLAADVNYTYASLRAETPTLFFGRAAAADNAPFPVDLFGMTSMKIVDFATARLRAGWIVSDFVPYATFGVTAGRADITHSVTVRNATGGDLYTVTETQNNMFIYGLSGGLGVDYLAFSSLFLRFEYEYVRFFEVSRIKPQLHTGRVGVGYKF